MYEYFQFFSPTKIVFGIGVSKDFSSEVTTLRINKTLVISDNGIASAGLIDPVISVLKESGVDVVGPYLGVEKDSPISSIKRCVEFGRRHGVDSLLAIGGGSVIDTAKASNIMITHYGDLLADYAGVQTIPSGLKPLIVIPTTAGTGSEVTSAAVVLDEVAGVKHSFVDDFLKPTLAILDPELTLKKSPKLTSATGIDAFSHALEAFTSPMRSPISDGLAVEALRMVKQYLLQVLMEPQNMFFRSEMMTAATIAGMAFDNAMVGVVHGIAHALGAIAGLHHGEAIFLALPVGISYNKEHVGSRYAELARRLDIVGHTAADDEAKEAFYKWVQKWRREVADRSELALSFEERGINEEQLERVAAGAVNDGTSFYNPREVVASELIEYLKKKYE